MDGTFQRESEKQFIPPHLHPRARLCKQCTDGGSVRLSRAPHLYRHDHASRPRPREWNHDLSVTVRAGEPGAHRVLPHRALRALRHRGPGRSFRELL